jgi:hypothetical protein
MVDLDEIGVAQSSDFGGDVDKDWYAGCTSNSCRVFRPGMAEGYTKVKRRIHPRVAGILVTLGIFLSVGVFTTTAQANAIDFMCPGRTVCVFPNNDRTGNYGDPWDGPAELATDKYNGQWRSFASVHVTPNPGSVNNNSGSCLWVRDMQNNLTAPIEPGGGGILDHFYGYFFIQFGVHPCPATPPPGAP